MGYFKILKKSNVPNRLFIGGLHGREGESTLNILNQLNNDDVKIGKLVIHNCDYTPYLSTLRPEYYNSEIGKEILYLIDYYHPQVYIELHCYKKENYNKLTDPQRQKQEGVPPLIELEMGVLIGSVSPFIRTSLFKTEDICMTLEMPCNPNEKVQSVVLNVLKIIAISENRFEIEQRMSKIYPEQVKTARIYAQEFFGDYPPF
jgi:hypothetical protein